MNNCAKYVHHPACTVYTVLYFTEKITNSRFSIFRGPKNVPLE